MSETDADKATLTAIGHPAELTATVCHGIGFVYTSQQHSAAFRDAALYYQNPTSKSLQTLCPESESRHYLNYYFVTLRRFGYGSAAVKILLIIEPDVRYKWLGNAESHTACQT